MLHRVGGHAVGGHEGLLVWSHVGEAADGVWWRGVHCLWAAAALVLLHLYCCALLLRDALCLHHETEIGSRVGCWEAVGGGHGHPLHSHL